MHTEISEELNEESKMSYEKRVEYFKSLGGEVSYEDRDELHLDFKEYLDINQAAEDLGLVIDSVGDALEEEGHSDLMLVWFMDEEIVVVYNR